MDVSFSQWQDLEPQQNSPIMIVPVHFAAPSGHTILIAPG